jgi:hypothetical protein
MNNLRRLFFHIFVWFASLSIVVSSIVFVLPNAELHKKRLNDNSFYDRINNQLKPEIGVDKTILQNSFSYILSNAIIKEIVNPIWLRGVVERNIDITSNWLNGKDNWELYVPIRDVEGAIQKSINTETDAFVAANKKELKVCTQNQSDTIKTEGFDLSKEFCIPSEVRNNQKTLTEFVSNSSAITSSAGILNTLIKDSSLSTTSEIQNVNELSELSSKSKQKIFSGIAYTRDLSLSLRNNIVGVFLIIIGLMITNILFLQLTRRNPLYFVFRSSFAIAFYTSVLSAIFVFVVGGSSYFSSLAKEFLLPGFVNSEVLKIVSGQLVTFALDLVFPAFAAAFGFFITGLVLWSLNQLNVFAPKKLIESASRQPNHKYKKLFRVPENPILSESKHNKKLELLKTYKPNEDNIKIQLTHNVISTLPDVIMEKEVQNEITTDLTELVPKTKIENEENKIVKRIQL